MAIYKPHYHIATGHENKNRGQLYLCANKGQDPTMGCCLEPAYDKRGRPIRV